MEAKKYLKQIRKMQLYIEQKQQQLQELKEDFEGVSAIKIDDVKIEGGAMGGAGFENKIVKAVILENEIKKDILKYQNLKNKIINEIQQLDNVVYSELLYKRYVEGKLFKKIAEEMGYIPEHIRRLHGKALKNFQKIIDVDTQCYK